MNTTHIAAAVAIWKEGPKPVGEVYHDWCNRISVSFVKSFKECAYAAMLKSILGQHAIEPEEQGAFPRVPEWEAHGHFVEHAVFEGKKGRDEMFLKYKNNFCNLTKLKKTPSEILLNEKYKEACKQADEVLKQKYMMKFINHKNSAYHIVIEFEIDGIAFKCEIDCLNLVKFFELDFKTARSITEEFYNKKTRKHEGFIKANDYATQRAVYQNAVFQKYGIKVLPMIAAVSKEKVPDYQLFEFRNQPLLDAKFADVQEYLPYLVSILNGEQLPHQCHTCEFCRRDKVVSGVMVVSDSEY